MKKNVESAKPSKILYSREEAAEALAISPRALDYLLADGTIPRRRIGGRVSVHVKALQAFAESDHTAYIVPKAA